MAPEVVLRKLAALEQLLSDLQPYEDASVAEVKANHYKIERIFELLATVASDLLFHLLAEQGQKAASYRETFLLAAECGLIPANLGQRLGHAAAMRNVLVHLYESIDYSILQQAIGPALRDFGQFVATMADGQ